MLVTKFCSLERLWENLDTQILEVSSQSRIFGPHTHVDECHWPVYGRLLLMKMSRNVSSLLNVASNVDNFWLINQTSNNLCCRTDDLIMSRLFSIITADITQRGKVAIIVCFSN